MSAIAINVVAQLPSPSLSVCNVRLGSEIAPWSLCVPAAGHCGNLKRAVLTVQQRPVLTASGSAHADVALQGPGGVANFHVETAIDAASGKLTMLYQVTTSSDESAALNASVFSIICMISKLLLRGIPQIRYLLHGTLCIVGGMICCVSGSYRDMPLV